MIELNHSDSIGATKQMKQSFAGDVFNTAIYLKRLFQDIDVRLVTAVGQDHFSEEMVAFFESESLNTKCVYKSEDKIPGLYAISLDEQGERSFTYWRENSAARTIMNFINDDMLEQFERGDVFFFSGISLGVVLPEQRPMFWQRVQQLKSRGVKIVFDLNYRPKLWQSTVEAKEQFYRAFESADVLLPGVDDFAAIFNVDTVEGVIEFFSRYQFDELIVKNGEKNVYCITPHQREIVNVSPVENVIDTTSAGDSFNGGYLGARMAGMSVVESVKLANNVAGFVIQHKGAIVDHALFSSRFN